MLTFLLACLKGSTGPAGATTLTGVNLTRKYAGTSCGDPTTIYISPVYTGDPSGITITLEWSWDKGDFVVIAAGLDPVLSFPYTKIAGDAADDVTAFYNKFGRVIKARARITNEADPADTATSNIYSDTYTECV